MDIRSAITEVRRKIGIIFPDNKGDIEWICRKVISQNKKVFEGLK